MKTLSVALKDLQILFKDRGMLFQLFLLPLLFIVVFSGALNAIGQGEEVSLPVLAVLDLDGGAASQSLLSSLKADGSLAVQDYSTGEVETLLEENNAVAILTIPPMFSARVEDSQPVKLILTKAGDAGSQQVEAIKLVIESIAADMTLESQIIASLEQMGAMQANAPEKYHVFTTERVLTQARSQFISAEARPLIKVNLSTPRQEADETTAPDLSLSAVPGFTVLFVFLAAQTTARSIYEEKKIGSFRRLVAAPLTRTELLIGKILPNFIVGLVQIAIIFLFGSVGMRLLGLTHLPVEKAPLGTFLIAVMLALCSSAFGIAISAIARTENQISGLGTLLLWGMGLLGGCFVPLFILERFLGSIPMIVPHYWANRALDNLLIRGLPLADISIELVVLLGFSLLFFVIGLWRFDFER